MCGICVHVSHEWKLFSKRPVRSHSFAHQIPSNRLSLYICNGGERFCITDQAAIHTSIYYMASRTQWLILVLSNVFRLARYNRLLCHPQCAHHTTPHRQCVLHFFNMSQGADCHAHNANERHHPRRPPSAHIFVLSFGVKAISVHIYLYKYVCGAPYAHSKLCPSPKRGLLRLTPEWQIETFCLHTLSAHPAPTPS